MGDMVIAVGFLASAGGSSLDKVYNAMLYVLLISVGVFVLVAIALGVNALRKKGIKNGTKSREAGTSSVKNYYPVTKLCPIDGFYSGMIVQDGGQRFIAGVRCYGFDFFSSDVSVQRNCIAGYRSLIMSISEPVSLYSSYHSFDISKQIMKHEDALERIRKELAEAKGAIEAFDVALTEMPMAEASARREEMDYRRSLLVGQVESLMRQEQHMISMTQYLQSFTSGQEEQFQDYSYYVAYNVPADEESEPFEVRAENARHELEIAIHNLRSRLNTVGVTAKRLSDEDLQVAVYRHSHPSGRNASDEEVLSYLMEHRTIGHDGIVRTEV